MNNDYRITTDLAILEEYLGTATEIAFDFEAAANPPWTHEQAAVLSRQVKNDYRFSESKHGE